MVTITDDFESWCLLCNLSLVSMAPMVLSISGVIDPNERERKEAGEMNPSVVRMHIGAANIIDFSNDPILI